MDEAFPAGIAEAAASGEGERQEVVIGAADRLRKRDFTPSPSKKKCASCDVRSVCGSAK